MEQRHRCIADVGRAEAESVGHRHAGDRHLAVAAHHRLGVTAGARGEDQHEQIVGLGRLESHLGIVVRGHLVGPFGGVDVDVVDIAKCRSRIRIGQHQLAIGMIDVSGQRGTAAHRVEANRHDSRHSRGDQHRGEERRVLQQHSDVWRPGRVESRPQRRRYRGAVPEMITPVDERILEVDAPILDIDERRQQVDDGRKRQSLAVPPRPFHGPHRRRVGHARRGVASSRPMRSSAPVAPPSANSVCLAARK